MASDILDPSRVGAMGDDEPDVRPLDEQLAELSRAPGRPASSRIIAIDSALSDTQGNIGA